ncbi:putative dTDP-glucose 4,6-dehydratase 2 [Candidatus Xenohaliotis californiensis]|uniref:dTDP-glucose 4,6-dehydratase 2 n=1 Tax=Candidatus Xenohaliotis californiensis TaxID=84677 RepID=A0ABP0ETL2_9RICK|nr:putative dTDP-glucose 4,6-dehydratase 2 [Candidatus Xenohaliotis californiensis]
MTVLIAGGAGFIGLHVVNLFIERGHDVVVMDYINANSIVNAVNQKARLVKVNFTNPKLLADILLNYDVNIVIDLTTESSYLHMASSQENSGFVDTNLSGFANAIQTIFLYWNGLTEVQKRRFVYLRTFPVDIFDPGEFGSKIGCQSLIKPSSVYGAVLAFKFHAIKAWHESFGFPAIAMITPSIYGPYQTNLASLVPSVMYNAFRECSITIRGDGKHVRNWLYISDHCDAMYLAITRGKAGSTYFVSPSNTYYTIDIVHKICSIMDELIPRENKQLYADLIKFVSYEQDQHSWRVCDDLVSKQQIGFIANHDISSGLRKTVEWFLSVKQSENIKIN